MAVRGADWPTPADLDYDEALLEDEALSGAIDDLLTAHPTTPPGVLPAALDSVLSVAQATMGTWPESSGPGHRRKYMVLNLPLEEKPSKDGAPVREALRIIGVAGPNYGEFADVHPDRSFSLYFNLNREATLFEERLVEKERAYQGCDLEGDVFTIHAQASSLPRDIEVITSLLQSCEAAARNQEIIAINKFNEVKRVVKDLNSEIAPAPKHTL